jgi:flagellar basal body rod protein FlgG
MHIGWDMAAYMGVRASRELEVVSHNLANASTRVQAGALEQLASEQSEVAKLRVARPTWTSQPGSQSGALQTTESETDRPEGRGFFKVETPRACATPGTRFRLTPRYCDPEGYPVLGKKPHHLGRP